MTPLEDLKKKLMERINHLQKKSNECLDETERQTKMFNGSELTLVCADKAIKSFVNATEWKHLAVGYSEALTLVEQAEQALLEKQKEFEEKMENSAELHDTMGSDGEVTDDDFIRLGEAIRIHREVFGGKE